MVLFSIRKSSDLHERGVLSTTDLQSVGVNIIIMERTQQETK